MLPPAASPACFQLRQPSALVSLAMVPGTGDIFKYMGRRTLGFGIQADIAEGIMVGGFFEHRV